MILADIRTDEDLVAAIDNLRHYMKSGIPYSPMRAEFVDILKEFCFKHRLDLNQHHYAALPNDECPHRFDSDEVCMYCQQQRERKP